MNKFIYLTILFYIFVIFQIQFSLSSCGNDDFNPTTANIGECSSNQRSGFLPASAEYGTETLKVWSPEELSESERSLHEERMAFILAISKQTRRKFVTSIYHQNGTLMCYGINTGKPNLMTHGEVAAVNNCTAMYGIKEYKDMTLYTTGEPCPMCASAILWLNFKTVVWGTANADLLCKVCMGNIPMDSSYIFSRYYGVRSTPPVLIGGILKEETDAWFTSYCRNSSSVYYVKPMCACYNQTVTPLIITQSQTSVWYEGNNGVEFRQYEGTITNNGNQVITNPTFTSSPTGLKPKTVWGLKNVRGDVWELSYYPVIQASGGKFGFGYIIEGSQQINFIAN